MTLVGLLAYRISLAGQQFAEKQLDLVRDTESFNSPLSKHVNRGEYCKGGRGGNETRK